MVEKDQIILKFLEIPVPIGTAGAFIWALAYFLELWNPHEYSDFEVVFSIFWMRLYTMMVILALFAYYVYMYVESLRVAIVHHNIRKEESKNRPPQNMILVPGGRFKFGLEGKDLFLDSFFIDKYLVTNEEYNEFINNTDYPPPKNWNNGSPPSDKLRHPVTCVNYKDALAFCRWRSDKIGFKIDLPTEEQWEKAARGPFGYNYPWGKLFDPRRCNVGKGNSGLTNEVDSYPNGRSLYGCYDMCGNVWEWTKSCYDPENEIRVLKGGSYYFDQGFSSLWLRYNDPSKDAFKDLGFRCVHTI